MSLPEFSCGPRRTADPPPPSTGRSRVRSAACRLRLRIVRSARGMDKPMSHGDRRHSRASALMQPCGLCRASPGRERPCAPECPFPLIRRAIRQNKERQSRSHAAIAGVHLRSRCRAWTIKKSLPPIRSHKLVRVVIAIPIPLEVATGAWVSRRFDQQELADQPIAIPLLRAHMLSGRSRHDVAALRGRRRLPHHGNACASRGKLSWVFW